MKKLVRLCSALALIPGGYYFIFLLMEASQTRDRNMLMIVLLIAVVNTALLYGVWQPRHTDYQAGNKRLAQLRRERHNAQIASKFDEIE